MQFENNRCYSTVLHFAVSGTRLLYQQSSELLAKAASSQTVLPSIKSCSQTAPATCWPCCQADNMAKGIYCKSRVSAHNFKTAGLQVSSWTAIHMTTEPRQASKLHITSHQEKLPGATQTRQDPAAAARSTHVFPLLPLHPHFLSVRLAPGSE